MEYEIYFDESNKLDQPNGKYSYYGAFGSDDKTIAAMNKYVKEFYKSLHTDHEMHFVDYTSDAQFEKYFRTMNYVINQDININLMIVNKKDALHTAKQMGISILELRELFYVKIPERLFYGMTRKLTKDNNIQIVIDENSEYEKLNLEAKLKEQMNAHSAYRNKGYTVGKVIQVASDESIPIQMVDVFMGIIVFLIENQKLSKKMLKNNVTLMVKSDLVYRLLIHEDNLNKFHRVVKLFGWGEGNEKITEISLSEFTGNFILHKTQFDIEEMNRLAEIMLKHPDQNTKFYREEMGYKNRQLRALQGYLDELRGKGRNSYFE